MNPTGATMPLPAPCGRRRTAERVGVVGGDTSTRLRPSQRAVAVVALLVGIYVAVAIALPLVRHDTALIPITNGCSADDRAERAPACPPKGTR
jgi:hypothetical protein